MNTLLQELKNEANLTVTDNGAAAYKSTLDMVYDLFAFGGAYRNRTDEDCIFLFKKALEENESLALKCLFYLRDILDGQGERRFFRICYRWLCMKYPEIAKRNLKYISDFGRWDDLIYIATDTGMQEDAFYIIKEQLALDLQCNTPSLLAKWIPSENTSSSKTKYMANKLRKYLKLSHKDYRKILSKLREKINVLERLISANRWEEIEFDKIPSKAGLKYKNAFARRDLIAKKYENFIKNEKTTVNTKTLYPYDVVNMATKHIGMYYHSDIDFDDVDRLAIEKYWNQLPNYCGDKECNMLCVCDTSGSMTWGSGAAKPIDVAIALSMYTAERAKGPFQEHYISFSSRPQLISIEGIDFVDKVSRIYNANLCENTNINAVFDMLKDMVTCGKAKVEDLPETIIIISDMQIDEGSYHWSPRNAKTEMEKIRVDWAAAGLKLPKLVYWNVNASNDTVLDAGPNVTLCSGASPILFQQIMKGVTGWELCKEKILSPRYECIK